MRPIPSSEIELLLLCARMHVDDNDVRRLSRILDGTIDWNGFISMARHHGVVALVHKTLSSLGAGTVPPDILGRLRSLSGAVRLQNLLFTSELLTVLRALENAGITAVPYKGPALAAFLYKDIGLRQFVDIDLLVRPCDAIRSRRVLLDLGCIPRRKISKGALPAYVRLHCGFDFTSKKKIIVEVNWRTLPWYWCLPEIPDSAWEKLGRLQLVGNSVPWFANEDLLLVLSLHGCKHKWEMLKWIADIAELLRVSPDLEFHKILRDAHRGGYERILALGLFLAHDLLDARLPDDVLAAISNIPQVKSLAVEVCDNLFDATALPADTLTELSFLANVSEAFQARVACRCLRPLYYLLHRLARPGMAALRRVIAR